MRLSKRTIYFRMAQIALQQDALQYAITSAILRLFVRLQLRQSWKLKARPCINCFYIENNNENLEWGLNIN